MTLDEFLTLSKDITLIMVILSLAVAFIRLARGPSLEDRVVALDMMTVSLLAVCGVLAMSTSQPALLDVALVLALVGFLATVALARYAERRDASDKGKDDV